jgi:N-acetylmuramoyl-L-alanine amidase
MIVILDAGHGGLIDGKYQTGGKRSPKRPDGTVLYEGVNNRRIIEELKKAFDKEFIQYVDVVDSQEDVSLSTRVRRANAIKGNTLYLSIHSNAAGNSGWSDARGFGTYIYTSPSKKTEALAEIMHRNLWENLSEFTKDRGIRKRNFYVLRATNCPAILLELGFHTNLAETYLIESKEWSDAVVKAIVNFVKEAE